MLRRKSGRQGMAMAVTLVTLAIVSLLGLAMGTIGMQSMNEKLRDSHNTQAFYAAEAGVLRTIREVDVDNSWSTGYSNQALSLANAQYTVTIYNNLTGTSDLVVPGVGTIPMREAYVHSEGQAGPVLLNGQRRVKRVLKVYLYKLPGNLFPYAAFGDQGVTMGGGATTDSFNSSVGNYASTQASVDGDIGTNGTSVNIISLGGTTTTVNGDVAVGVGGVPATAIRTTGGASYSSSSVLTSPVPMDSVQAPTGTSLGDQSINGTVTLPPGIYGSLTATGGANVTLTSGTYVFTTLSLSGSAQLNISVSGDPVIIYILGDGSDATKDLDLGGGGLMNTSQDSTKCIILGTDGCTRVEVAGGADAYYAVYAPKADMTVTGGGDVYGSLIGKTITNTGGADIHYDKALENYDWGQVIKPFVGAWMED
ncbi:MAG: pilus assembly PilX N-terminal domain-containing protein [Armatimonadetes bacterium]|nr:pilus assembly PilX N-terminal domain-containing protein [Armatimonadota bacterium]